MTATAPGIDHERVTAWLTARVPGLVEPLRFDPVVGGHSNLTYIVADQTGRRMVLRRPPLHQVLATAHDMEREHRIIAALGPTPVPVPGIIGLCTDGSVNERPFYVMEFVDGLVVRRAAEAEALPVDVRRHASRSLAETLAAIHAVDPDAVGLGDLGKKEDYVARQLRRWLRQFRDSETKPRPQVVELHDLLEAQIPAQRGAAIVHGDYRLDNCIISPSGEVEAVLDWELCTLGDPLVDVAQLLVYWAEPDDPELPLENPPSTAGGFATREELTRWYVEASGTDVGDLAYYLSFACWRLVCILEGVYSRYVGGAMGDVPDNVEDFSNRIDGLLGLALAHAEAI